MVRGSVGFVGAGRVARILLAGWRRAGVEPARIVLSDTAHEAVDRLLEEYGGPRVVAGTAAEAASCDVVLLGLHPPALAGMLPVLRPAVDEAGGLVVSLAPKVKLAALTAALGGHERVARVLPNAPSVVGAGYNPVAFGPALGEGDRAALRALFEPLGAFPEVPEDTIEAYALIVAMGPTYLWFQLRELERLGRSFGLAEEALRSAMPAMVEGASATLYGSGLTADEVIDLIPTKPLCADEATIRSLYADRLTALHAKLTS